MFDAVTTQLIQSVVPLEGLDLNRLPQDLTEAYSSVVAARLATVGEQDWRVDDNWKSTFERLSRIAETYEAMAIFLHRNDPHSAACAFVSGSAHYTLSQARLVEGRRSGIVPTQSSLSSLAVAPEVAASLLFMAGGHQADAAETAKLFRRDDGNTTINQLLDFLAQLASGSGSALQQIANATILTAPNNNVDYAQTAEDKIWSNLSLVIQQIARVALGLESRDPLETLNKILEQLSRNNTLDIAPGFTVKVSPSLPGPHHFARLLSIAAAELLSSMVFRIDPPSGIDGSSWLLFKQDFATRRPFLWKNHKTALNNGFLTNGKSFVLTFPTGAGKTTITELRIAVELLRGRQVIYLVPTRALVDQVSQEISRTVNPISADVVRGRFLEDFGEKPEARVFVQTPEQCLAYLSYDPEGFNEVGLIVVDECHQLSGVGPDADGTQRPPTRRSIDAMWSLLSLLQLSPEADIVLISAMVSNGQSLSEWLQSATGRPAQVLDLAWKPTRQVRGVVAYEAAVVEAHQKTLNARRRLGASPSGRDRRGLTAIPLGLFCHTQVWNKKSSFARYPLLSTNVELGVGNHWNLTANRNHVGGRLLGAMALAGMRPIVFSQVISYTKLIAQEAAAVLKRSGCHSIALLPNEVNLLAAAADELGGSALVEGPVDGMIGIHHGLLLLPERLAMESAFRRDGGLYGLVATPTIAQGINLPAEAVIIAGDDRWTDNDGEGSPETLAVHELLNAAGRAGRAGHYAHGIVIDVPGKIFSVSQGKSGIRFTGIDHVMGLFGLPDQCLSIVDPINQVIDRIASSAEETDVGNYLLRRVGGINEGSLRSILGRSLNNATRIDRENRSADQASLLIERASIANDDPALTPWKEFASQAGVSPQIIAAIVAAMPSPTNIASWSFRDAVGFYLQLINRPGFLFGIVDPMSCDLNRIIPRGKSGPKDFEAIDAWETRWRFALNEALQLWMSGAPIDEIGSVLHRHRNGGSRPAAIELGRRFSLQTTSGIGYGLSLITRLIEMQPREDNEYDPPTWLELISGCAREGFDHPDKLMLYWRLRRHTGLYPRVRVHKLYGEIISGRLPDWNDLSALEDRRRIIHNLVEEAGI